MDEKQLFVEKPVSFSVSTSEGFSKQQGEEWDEIPRSQRALLSLWHTLTGCMALLAWNIVLNVTMLLQNVLWPDNVFSDVLLGSNQAGAVLTVLTLIILDRQTYSKLLARVTPFIAIIAAALLPIPAYTMAGNTNVNKAKALYCVVVFLLGICAGVYNTQGFAFAALVPRSRDQSIFMSTGNGLAGVLSWVFFTICYELIFEKNNLKHSAHLILVMCIMAALMVILTAVVQELCFRIPQVNSKLLEVNRVRAPSLIDPSAVEEGHEGHLPGTSFMSTLKQCIFAAFEVGFVLFATIFVFPACGPYGWPVSESMTNVNMGIFQILDLVFRFIPVLGSWTIFAKIPTRIVIFARPLVLFPLFIIPVYLPTLPFFSNPIWLTFLMVFMVLSNGWFISCAIVHCMGTATNKKEAETTANIMTMCIVLGALLGAFGSKIPLLGVPKEK